ncbi:family 20 glycosylhydrolase, partial [Salmonella sp. s54836]|uniref:family 20 glycosylhydrolase n=1 Tax=Salmonella sp. s54836 TaxID=3159673 RepID=UPI00397E977A
ELEAVTKAGYTAILSSCWYLDSLTTAPDWINYYNCDPHNFNGTAEMKSRVLGGEACAWTDYMDATNYISRIWPRALGAAERLWSINNTMSTDYAVVYSKLH